MLTKTVNNKVTNIKLHYKNTNIYQGMLLLHLTRSETFNFDFKIFPILSSATTDISLSPTGTYF